MSAPMCRVESASLTLVSRVVAVVPMRWTLSLDCGHLDSRPIVRSSDADDFVRLPPRRVRCRTCERQAREASR